MAANNLIYIADDQADYRFVLSQLFSRYLSTYAVRFFDGGNALLAELAKENRQPAMIILDRHMPSPDGQQTLLTLKQNPCYQRIPVVMMSSDASVMEVNNAYTAGLNSFLKKEPEFIALKQTMETACHYWLETNQQPIDN